MPESLRLNNLVVRCVRCGLVTLLIAMKKKMWKSVNKYSNVNQPKMMISPISASVLSTLSENYWAMPNNNCLYKI